MPGIPYKERKFDRKNKMNYDAEYRKNNYDQVNLLLPKGYKDMIKEKAAANGVSISEWIRIAIDNYPQ